MAINVIDNKGYRAAVGVIIVNADKKLFWAKRIRQDGWQFPQGGVDEGETSEEAMFRELHEEVGLTRDDVKILATTKKPLYYRLPHKLVRRHSSPLCIGQKQTWFLLEFVGKESSVDFNITRSPEFDAWRWIDYWKPLKHVIHFKRRVYRQALQEFELLVFKDQPQKKSKARGRGLLGRKRQR